MQCEGKPKQVITGNPCLLPFEQRTIVRSNEMTNWVRAIVSNNNNAIGVSEFTQYVWIINATVERFHRMTHAAMMMNDNSNPNAQRVWSTSVFSGSPRAQKNCIVHSLNDFWRVNISKNHKQSNSRYFTIRIQIILNKKTSVQIFFEDKSKKKFFQAQVKVESKN